MMDGRIAFPSLPYNNSSNNKTFIYFFGSEKRDQQKGGYDRWHGRLGK